MPTIPLRDELLLFVEVKQKFVVKLSVEHGGRVRCVRRDGGTMQ